MRGIPHEAPDHAGSAVLIPAGPHVVTSWDERGLLEDLLARGVDDFIDVGLVVQIAKRSGATDEEALRAMTLGLITEALALDLMVAGSVRSSFDPWRLSAGESAARFARELNGVQLRDLRPADICWLMVTRAGAELGREVLRREGTLTPEEGE